MTAALAVLNEQKFWINIDGLSIRKPFDFNAGVSQVFGQTSITGNIHKGIDWVFAYQPLRAVLPGHVVSTYPYGRDVPGLGSDGSPGGYGSTVLVGHDVPGVGTFFSYYCHMSAIWVKYGDQVAAGQVVGISGTTGISTGPHLHFEMRWYDNATRFDPMPFVGAVITPPDPWEEFMAELTEAQKGFLLAQATQANVDAAAWTIDNKGSLAPLALAARDAGFTAGADTGDPADPVSKGIRQAKRLLAKMMGPVMPSPVKTVDKLVKDLSVED